LDGFQLAHPRDRYIDNIKTALDLIRDGESYEVCLTTQITAHLPEKRPDAFLFYRHLRDRNPAPYSAFIRFDTSMIICCSSPERYLLVDRDGNVSMKPIKGTRARCRPRTQDPTKIRECQVKDSAIAKELETNEKDRAENLMIVDLIRNDLNLISEANSVHVPALMKVETYATVHQLVSTIASKLRKDLTCVDAVARCFPPGSMTGAPKKRTVEILQKLEGIPRGPYSGTLGYFSMDGAAHFNVVIRTAVLFGSKVSVGAGGAIVALSDPEAEFEEMILKSNSVIPSVNDVYRIS
jgi:para-aminobenzoate synthetase